MCDGYRAIWRERREEEVARWSHLICMHNNIFYFLIVGYIYQNLADVPQEFCYISYFSRVAAVLTI